MLTNEIHKNTKYFIYLIFVSVILRLFFWYLIPESRFASDEEGYFSTGIFLYQNGYLENKWPPIVPILISSLNFILDENLKFFRLFWVFLDIINIFLIFQISSKIFIFENNQRSILFPYACALFYALYIPSISFSQFLTSEIPTLFLILLIFNLMLGKIKIYKILVVLTLSGVLVLVRTNLLPIVLGLSFFCSIYYFKSFASRIIGIILFSIFGYMLLFIYIGYNYSIYDKITLTYGSSYNLYIGNRDHYTEDLNIFNPLATKEQIIDRDLSIPKQSVELSEDEMKDLAINYIKDHPLTFVRRAIGRFARIFAPKTAQLQLIGGESSYPVTNFYSLTLLISSLFQYGFILFLGLLFLINTKFDNKKFKFLSLITIFSSIILCLIAISKPRYSFPFDFIFIIYSVYFFYKEKGLIYYFRKNKLINLCFIFIIIWFWLSWFIFSLSSRGMIF